MLLLCLLKDCTCAGGSVLPPHTDGEAIPTGCVVHPTPYHVLAA